MDTLDKQIKIKKFLKLIYRGTEQDEYIRIFQNNSDNTYNKATYYNNIDDVVKYCSSKYCSYNNVYFELSTTDGTGGATENLKYRHCLAFDFDKKDHDPGFNHIDILNRFRDLKIHYHAIIDSGNGYHVYVCINKTNDFEKVQEVQKVLCDKLQADKNAIKSTQILRVPYTLNIKRKPFKMVKMIHIDDRNSNLFKPYDIDFLFKMNCRKIEEVGDKQTTYTINSINIPKCIENILINGTQEGDRYQDLQKIVVLLRQRKRTLSEVQEVCKEWGIKSQYNDNLEYRVESIYNNLNYISMNCKECKHKEQCYNTVISNFEYTEDTKLIQFNEKDISKIKKNNRRGAKTMKANDLLVYSVLKLHNDGLYRNELEKELTYKSRKKSIEKVALSKNTLTDALKSLEQNGFITVEVQAKNKKLYKIIDSTSTIDMTFNISYSATMECIKGSIATEEYKLYCYMRYLHHKEQREEPKALKGNLFQVNEVELAEPFGVTQQRISQMIINLVDEKLLSMWYRQESKNNGFIYNIYRLNY